MNLPVLLSLLTILARTDLGWRRIRMAVRACHRYNDSGHCWNGMLLTLAMEGYESTLGNK